MFDLPAKKTNFAASIIPTGGQFIENKNARVSQSFARVVGRGLGDEGSNAFNRKSGVLGELAEDTHLPDELEEDFKDNFNEQDNCELCDSKFKKVGNPRHHCRKCYKSVCQKCSNNKRKLAKKDDTLYRCCDFCDTQLSNYKLEQNQQAIIKAQEEQMQMYIEQLQCLDQQKDMEMQQNEENKTKFKQFLQNELKRKDDLEKNVQKLEKKTESLNDTRTKLFTQINELDALI